MTSCINNRHPRPVKPKSRSGMSQVRFGEDGDFFVMPSDHEQTFKVAFDDDIVRGMYQDLTQRSIVYLRNHSCIEDIISTCNHEALHHCFVQVLWGTNGDEPIDMDVYQEHWAIRQVEWATETIVRDKDPSRNQALREEY